jgi:hypothetical protein
MSRHKNPLPLTPHANVNVSVHDKVLPGMSKALCWGTFPNCGVQALYCWECPHPRALLYTFCPNESGCMSKY